MPPVGMPKQDCIYFSFTCNELIIAVLCFVLMLTVLEVFCQGFERCCTKTSMRSNLIGRSRFDAARYCPTFALEKSEVNG